MHVAVAILFTPPLLLGVVWCSAALWFDGPWASDIAGIVTSVFAAGCFGVLLLVRPYSRGLLVVLTSVLIVFGWWLTIEPSNERDWLPDVAHPATAAIDGSQLTVHNVRNFDYRSESDYVERWESRTYDLDRLRGVDLFLCFWGPTAITHTIASWEFTDNTHLAISIETRKEQGETYSAVRGFFRQFEVYYVVADERDVVRLRTNYRGEQVFLYRISVPVDEARELLLDYLAEINRLAQHPRWYNALTHNCTTAIRYHMQNLGKARPLDWRILANGRIDELLYERGSIGQGFSLADIRQRSDITKRAIDADQDPFFSARIREGLPGDLFLPDEGGDHS